MSRIRLIMDEQRRPERPRTVGTVEAELRAMLAAGELELPRPGCGATAQRWAVLADWGRWDLALARLAEGHTDALAVLAEAGRAAVPDALYGVWAARSGGTGARLLSGGDGLLLEGTIRFCSGVRSLDRALVVADAPGTASSGRLLVDVVVAHPRVHLVPDTWQTSAMDAADTQDVRFDELPVERDVVIGAADWYNSRPGFAFGAAGVAAVWWGGAAGLLHRVTGHLSPAPDAHQLAHLGELHALLEAADALLARTATALDAAPGADHSRRVAEVRCAVERAAREVIDRAPRMVGPAPLSRDGELARALADLALYIRQHHAERDHAALGAQVLAARRGR
ncbi:MAG: acyl-CoA dehydrogenase family protein [Pseudonocardiaceae bacterium]